MMTAEFIAAQRTDYGIPHAVACRALDVSEPWFYKWKGRPATARQERRARLDAAVRASFEWSKATYGSPRVHADLVAEGWAVSVNSVADSMLRQGLVARVIRRRRGLTRPDRHRRRHPDLLGRDFTAPAPNLCWVGDLTEIPTDEGKLYLSTAEDLFGRVVAGFAIGEHHDAALVCATLQTAVAFRGGVPPGLVFHTDQGSEYNNDAVAALCGRLGIVQSTGRVGSALDNAVAESFNSTLEWEVLSRHRFATKDQARLAVATWIVDTYNARRRHSSAAMLPPVEYERLCAGIVGRLLGYHDGLDPEHIPSKSVDSLVSSTYVHDHERRATG